jgi:hypothetical protein
MKKRKLRIVHGESDFQKPLNNLQIFSFLALVHIFPVICFAQTVWELKSPTLAAKPAFWGVAYGNNKFIAVGSDGIILSSPDGKTWTVRDSNGIFTLTSVTYGAGKFIAVGEYGRTRSSSTGDTWETIVDHCDTYAELSSVAYGNNRFVAVGGSRYYHYSFTATSADGTSWSSKTSGNYTNTHLNSVVYGNGNFLAVGDDCPIISYSSSWQAVGTTNCSLLNSITYGNNRYVAVGLTGSITSLDGISWENTSLGNTSLTSVTYGNGQYVAVGPGGAILVSSDGSAWTTKSSPTTQQLNSVAYGNGLYVAVGWEGTILTAKSDKGFAVKPVTIKGDEKLSLIDKGDCLLLHFSHSYSSRPFLVKIFALSGKTIYSSCRRFNDDVLKISTKAFPKGAYSVSVSEEKGKIRSWLIIKT